MTIDTVSSEMCTYCVHIVRQYIVTIITIIIIIIIIIIPVITFMHVIYSNVPETTPVSTVHSVAAVLYLQFALHVMLFRPWNMFRTFTLALSVVCVQCPIRLLCAVPNTVLCNAKYSCSVQCPIWLLCAVPNTVVLCSAQYGCFCSSLISRFPGMLLRCTLSD